MQEQGCGARVQGAGCGARVGGAVHRLSCAGWGNPQPAKVQEAGWGPAAPRSLRGVRGHKTYSLRNLERNKAQAGNAFGVTAISPPVPPHTPPVGVALFVCAWVCMYHPV